MLSIIDAGYHNTIFKILFLASSFLVKPLVDKYCLSCLDKDARTHTGRLAVISDPELKFRVIAMIDYLSQFTLRPIHKGLLSLLRKLPQDRTFTQNPFND